MTPSLARLDAADCAIADSVFGGDDLLLARVGTDGKNLRLGKFCRRATLPAIASAVLDAVKLIVSGRIPSQVFKSVVPRIAVVVAAFHPLRARANKGSQHKRMRLENLDAVVSPKADKWAVLLLIERVNLFAARARVSQPTAIRHLVKTFVPNNRFPVFHDFPHMWNTGSIA